jgi:hypothetical protein
MGGSAAVLKLFGDRWLEKVKAKYSIELADRQNAFSMGASSHMAMVVFDKLIGFCEEYVEAISKPLFALIQEGKKDQPLDTRELFRIRQRWALWINDELGVKLDQFERGYKKLGGAPVFDANGATLSKDLSIRSVIAQLRNTLSIEEYTILRNQFVRDSIKSPQ